MSESQKLIVVSNRLPISLQTTGKDLQAHPSSGGLVTAMNAVLKKRGGIWVGWPGTNEDLGNKLDPILEKVSKEIGYSLKPIKLTAKEHKEFYCGFSNEIIWPLFHDFLNQCRFEPDYWEFYKIVNEKFAKKISEVAGENDYVWVQDYHLMLAAQKLKKLGHKTSLGFFLHIPFPSVDTFLKLPWRKEILKALTEYDLLGFQTGRDKRNFIQCLKMIFKHQVQVIGKGPVVKIQFGNRQFQVGYFPIGIDFNEFSQTAQSLEVTNIVEQIHHDIPGKIILGVDRLDYTKGILERLKAFEKTFELFPELQGNITFVQLVVPSREGIENYDELKTEVERLVSEINGKYTQSNWVPIHYMYRHLTRKELLAYYKTADAALVTPLQDGMNLVAKEYCAASYENNGVLILSEFAGSAFQLKRNALLVNPFDIMRMAEAIKDAMVMETREMQKRMKRMRQIIKKQDIHWWVNAFLDTAFHQKPFLTKQDSSHQQKKQKALPLSVVPAITHSH